MEFLFFSILSRSDISDGLFYILAIIFCVTIHEYAHGWVANRLGDPTARYLGRLTFNPLAHFDLFGTLALIFIGIGWGKPVPVNPNNFQSPRRDSALVSFAGPLSNFLSAVIFAIPLTYLYGTAFASTPGYQLLAVLFEVNILLFSLNILPFPPLDGSKIIGIFVPHRWSWHYERYLQSGTRYFIIFILFDLLFLERLLGYSLLSLLISIIAQWVGAIVTLGT